MTEPALQPLLTPVRMGDPLLPNRIVMAPLTATGLPRHPQPVWFNPF